MRRTIIFIMTIFFVTFLVGAENVSLKGTVKKNGGTTGIAGVKVSLIKLSALSTTTGTDGAFTLTSPSSIKLQNAPDKTIQFMIKGNTIAFAPTSKGICGSIAIFSSDGKLQSSIRLHDLSTGEQSIALPRLGSGINIMRVAVGPESFTRTLVCVGNDLVIKNEFPNANNSGRLMLAKQLTAAAVDTLKAEKDGYLVKKVAVENYTMDDIAISLDTNNVNPAREALKEIADSYVAAQKEGDPSKMPLASQVTYKQNLKTITANQSICKTKVPVDFTLSFFDVDSNRAFVEIISATGTPRVLMTWLKVQDGKISEIEAIVTTTGDWLFNAKKYLDTAKTQDWSILPESQRSTRQTLIKGGDAYLDMLGTKVDNVPWGHPCQRIEGGDMIIYPDCIEGMPGHGALINGTVQITKRRYAVDVDMGTVDIFCAFGGSMPDSHLFRLIDGKIRLVHTLSVQH